MSQALVKPIPALRHCFVAGLRFDREVQYQLKAGSAKRWCNLPIKPHPEEDAVYSQARGLRLGLMQCMAVVGQLPWSQVQQAIEPYMDMPLHDIDLGACGLGTAWDLGVCSAMDLYVQKRDSWRVWQTRLGQLVLEVVESGSMCVVGFDDGSSSSTRWASVVGVEYLVNSGLVRALLLLDASGDEPWACGHNARLELKAGRGAVCRHLGGQVFAAFATRLVVVQRRSI
jgi:hypothetical protein